MFNQPSEQRVFDWQSCANPVLECQLVNSCKRPDPGLHAESKVLERILEVIPLCQILGVNWLYRIILLHPPTKRKQVAATVRKERASAAKVRFSIRALLPSFSKRLGTRLSPQAQQNETRLLLPFSKQILYKTELQAAS